MPIPTKEELEAKYGCSYCCAVGACPRCLGRAGYDRLQRELSIMLSRAATDGAVWRQDEAYFSLILGALREFIAEAEVRASWDKIGGAYQKAAAVVKAWEER